MKIRMPNVDDKECYIEDKQSIVLLGANGAGKTRMSVWIDENNPELNIHRISAQKSLNMPEYVSPTELKKAEEYYVYTLVSLMEKFITIGTILLISVLIEKLVPTAFFLLFFLSLRKRTGGYHMNTFFQCYLGTVVTYMLVLGLCMVLVDYPQLVFGLLLVAICIVEVIGTVNHPNIHMDAVELSESKRAARILCAVEVCVIYTFTLLGADMMYVCHMAVAVILCAVLLLIAKILKQEVKRNEEN